MDIYIYILYYIWIKVTAKQKRNNNSCEFGPYASRIIIINCHQSSFAEVMNTTTITTALDLFLFLFQSEIQQQQ